MHKLLKVLAVSFGSGVLLGAGMRVGETLTPGRKSADPSSGRNSAGTAVPDTPAPESARRDEIRAWVAEDLQALLATEREHMAERVEEGLRARVMPRVESLEEQFVKHSQDMIELRDCSLRTERSLQRLLTGLDRFMNSIPQAGAQDSFPRETRGYDSLNKAAD